MLAFLRARVLVDVCSRAGWLTLGSLRNHDGEAEDNVDLNMILYFIHESPDTALQSFTLFITVKTIAKLTLEHSDKPSWFTFSKQRKIWSFHVVLQRTAKKCTKNYNARAQPLYCWLILLFSDVPAAVAVEVS